MIHIVSMTKIVDNLFRYFIVEVVAVSRAPGVGVAGVEWVDGSGGEGLLISTFLYFI